MIVPPQKTTEVFNIPLVGYGQDSVVQKPGQSKALILGCDGFLTAHWDIELDELDKDESEKVGLVIRETRRYAEHHLIPASAISRVFLGLNRKYRIWSLEIWQFTGDGDGPTLIYGFDNHRYAEEIAEKAMLWLKSHHQ